MEAEFGMLPRGMTKTATIRLSETGPQERGPQGGKMKRYTTNKQNMLLGKPRDLAFTVATQAVSRIHSVYG